MYKFEVPSPVLFNCWKHHKGFIRQKIREVSDGGEIALLQLPSELLVLGSSQLDVYTGDLFPHEIGVFIKNALLECNINCKSEFEGWLNGDKTEYKLFMLSDGSVWTIRLGEQEGKFIHIHPGRYSVNSIRMKALTLKTAILSIVYGKIFCKSPIDLQVINIVRKELLSECPVKSVSKVSSLSKTIELLSN